MTNKVRLSLDSRFLLMLIMTCVVSSAKADDSRWNIVLLFVDDLGWTEIQQRHPAYETPNIDGLASDGVEFTRAYVPSPTCSPSRAALVTGQHPARLRIVRHIPTGPKHPDFDPAGNTDVEWNQWAGDPANMPSRNWLPLEVTTYAEALRDLGYANHFVGKWHLGHTPFHPVEQGFESQFGTTNFGHPKSYRPPFFNHSDVLADNDGYLTDRLADETVRLIESATVDQPFMISHWFYGVHKPHVGRPDLVKKYRARGLEGNQLHFAAMLEALDEAVGRIREAIENSDVADRTAVFFCSDQGSWFENPPARGSKRVDQLFDASARVPLFANVPGMTRAGEKNDSLVSTLDLFPTFVELAGGDAKQFPNLDGTTFVPTLASGEEFIRNEPLVGYRAYENTYISARQDRWKLVAGRDGSEQLYNIEADPNEQSDVADKQPLIVEKLVNYLERWESRLGVNEYSGLQ